MEPKLPPGRACSRSVANGEFERNGTNAGEAVWKMRQPGIAVLFPCARATRPMHPFRLHPDSCDNDDLIDWEEGHVKSSPTVFVLDWLGQGGISRYVVDVANRLVGAHSVVVAGPSNGPASGSRAPVTTWFMRPGRKTLGDAVGAATGILSALLRPRRGDVVWLPLGLRPSYELALTLVLRARGARVIGTVHNRNPSHGPRPGVAIRLTVRVLNLAVAHTDEIAAWLRSMGIDVCRLPFPPLQPPDVRTRAFTRGELGIADDAVLVAQVGRLARYKGIGILVKAFAAALDHNEGCLHLLIAGEPTEGIDPAHLVAASGIPSDRITVIPRYLSDSELIGVLDMIDAIVLPYQYIDNSGIGSLAAYRQIPGIISDLPSLKAMFGEHARAFRPGDTEGLAAILSSTPRRSPSAVREVDELEGRDQAEYAEAVRRVVRSDGDTKSHDT